MKNQKKFIITILKKINELAIAIRRRVNLMEVCGTHTQVVSRYGIRQLMPLNVRLISGPGCPVCVTAQEDIDAVVNLALAGIPVAVYGDALRVPGHYGSLDDAGVKTGKVFSVYSAEEALQLQKKHSEMIFFGFGFETTAPMTAWLIKKACLSGRRGLTVYSAHKLFLTAMKVLIKMEEIQIDGFISPGHVSTVTGIKPYRKMAVPQVITGFEPEDVLLGIYMLLCQIREGRKEVENEYLRSVREEGNQEAMKLMFDVFEPRDDNWRGFGVIPKAGLKIKDKYKEFDARLKYKNILDKIDFSKSRQPTACQCDKIILGIKSSRDCSLFKKKCTPDRPFGPCMVSVEGACNVEYRFNLKTYE